MEDKKIEEGKIKDIFQSRDIISIIFLASVFLLISYLLVSEIVWRENDTQLSFGEFLMVDKLLGAAGESATPDLNFSSAVLKRISAINFDLNILRDKKFQGLHFFGQAPGVVKEKGRNNPFEPY